MQQFHDTNTARFLLVLLGSGEGNISRLPMTPRATYILKLLMKPVTTHTTNKKHQKRKTQILISQRVLENGK